MVSIMGNSDGNEDGDGDISSSDGPRHVVLKVGGVPPPRLQEQKSHSNSNARASASANEKSAMIFHDGDRVTKELEGSRKAPHPLAVNDNGSNTYLPNNISNNSTEAKTSHHPEAGNYIAAIPIAAKIAASIPATEYSNTTPKSQPTTPTPPPPPTAGPDSNDTDTNGVAANDELPCSPQKSLNGKDRRRKNRRRLHRLLTNPEVLPSFLRVIGERKKVKTEPNTIREIIDIAASGDDDSDDDFLLEPPMVVINVDEYLGLKKRKFELPEAILSAYRVGSNDAIVSPTVSNSNINSNDSRKKSSKRKLPSRVPSAALADTASAYNLAGDAWYVGSRPMAVMPDDAIYLTDNQQFIRNNMEFFSAKTEDCQNTSGRRAPLVPGRVGFRCVNCANAFRDGKSSSMMSGSMSFPVNFTSLYNLAIQRQQMHLEHCPHIPSNRKYRNIGAGPRKRMKMGIPAIAYWHISCRRLGMVELENNGGLRFGRDPKLDPLPFESIRVEVEQEQPALFPKQRHAAIIERTTPATVFSANPVSRIKTTSAAVATAATIPSTVSSANLPKGSTEVLEQAKREADNPTNQLIFKEDAMSLSGFMFLTLKQATFCHAAKEDFSTRGKKTKMMRLGFAGFCCRNCKLHYPTENGNNKTVAHVFQNSCRSFSSSRDNLASAMSNSFVLHLMKCIHTPQKIKDAIQSLKRVHSKQMQRLPYGSQSKLFLKIWDRIRATDKPFETGVDGSVISIGSRVLNQKKEVEEYLPDTIGSSLHKNEQTRSNRKRASPSRFINMPLGGVLANARKESPIQTGFVFASTLQKCAFTETKNSDTTYWQCSKCRMVPYDYRAPNSIFFSKPPVKSLEKHRMVCQNNGIYWDFIQSSLKHLQTKYGGFTPLANKESFFNLIRSVVGSEAEVIDTFMMKLGKKGHRSPPKSSNNRGIWRQLPLNVDFDRVEECFSLLLKDLNLPPASLHNTPDFLEFLRLTSCNFQIPLVKENNDENGKKESMSKTLVPDQQKKVMLVVPSGSIRIDRNANEEHILPGSLKNKLHTNERFDAQVPLGKSVVNGLSSQFSESTVSRGMTANKDLFFVKSDLQIDQGKIVRSKSNVSAVIGKINTTKDTVLVNRRLTRDQGSNVVDKIEAGQFDDA